MGWAPMIRAQDDREIGQCCFAPQYGETTEHGLIWYSISGLIVETFLSKTP
jgi:hypothetical protein